MTWETLRYQKSGGVAEVTLDRPSVANAIDLAMSKELLAVALECEADSEVRAVLLTGAGKRFCAGGDLAGFAEAGEDMPRLIREMTVHLHAAVSLFVRMRVPVVAAVQGAAAGAGLALACCADLVVAAESTKLTLAYTRAGLTPDGSSTWFLPRLIGRRRALELVLTNRVLSAAEALEWGLVNRVVADQELTVKARALAEELAAGPTLAFARAKRLLLESGGQGLESQLELESEAISTSAATADAQEGVAAFLGKRTPDFKGK